MTTVPIQTTTASVTPPQGSMFAAEARNVRATKTAYALLGGSVVMALASCLANLAVISDAKLGDPETLQRAMHASTVATLVFSLVAGLVLSTSDYRFGRIDQLLLSDPNRRRLLGTKATIGAALGTIYGLVGAVAAVGAISSFFAAKDVPLDIVSGAVLKPAVGVVLGAALFGAMGVGIGTAIQKQPAAIAGSLAFMLLVEPTMLLGLPQVGKWLPGTSGLALTLSPDPNLLGAVEGGLLLAGWTTLALVIGNHRLRSADI